MNTSVDSCVRGALAAALLVALTVTSAKEAIADADIGQTLASQCAQCHGTNGKPVGGIDDIAGEDTKSMYNKLLEMQSKTEKKDIMHVQIRGYTLDELWLISEYLASVPGN